jgi:DNA ligase (NAD+)
MSREGFSKLNAEMEKKGKTLFANPRNTTAGTLKMLNSSIVAKRPLDCFLYHLLCDQLPSDSHFENLEKAKSWGFKVSPHITKCKGINEVFDFISKWDTERKGLPFDIDGVVLKVNSSETTKGSSPFSSLNTAFNLGNSHVKKILCTFPWSFPL